MLQKETHVHFNNLFQKRVVRTKFDIYVFITMKSNTYLTYENTF